MLSAYVWRKTRRMQGRCRQVFPAGRMKKGCGTGKIRHKSKEIIKKRRKNVKKGLHFAEVSFIIAFASVRKSDAEKYR